MTAAQWQALVASGGVVNPAGNIWWPSREAMNGAETVKALDARSGAVPLADYATAREFLHCRFDVGDDAICIKSGKDEYGRKRGLPTEDVIVVDNIVYHGHGGFTVGSEMSGGVRNILVERCTFLGSDVGLRFKTTRGRGGVVEKIWIRDIQMKDISTDAIGFNMYYGGEAPTDVLEGTLSASRPAMPVNEGTPQFRDTVLTRILCRGAGRAVMLEGLPEMPIRGIVLDHVGIAAQNGLAVVDADLITLRRVEIAAVTGPAISVRDSRNITVDGVPFQADGRR
jgi:hypothetical protein